ncbi:DUF1018 domain-containing protein [Rhodobacter sp. NTK016B]|uniref:phage protein GemA/Gp16 family protein n=1 Tax=Rhodobacter sp. NTK016B TaxID=2759676 RepID=UPI001A8E958C|nr:phage protein GemA/Gp16 family protein [Rhodobacter sp. NTK016B]MBN8294716.1 DUF1018 domain-containing protein [Rhodobacter sp. NTK016B]
MSGAGSLMKQIHVACRQLGLDTETRRDLQLRAVGKASMSDMSKPELERLLEELKKRGFKPSTSLRHTPAPRADLRYVHVLWRLLGKAGVLDRPGRDGLNAFIRARFEAHWASVPIDVDALRDAGQINDLTRALQGMCRRHGVQVER